MTRLFRRDTHILGQSSHFHDWFPMSFETAVHPDGCLFWF
jgi:hypothetical protein